MSEGLAFKYLETQIPKGKTKHVMVIINGHVVGEFDAKLFHRWLAGKERELREWIEKGKVEHWYKHKELKINPDDIRYVG